MSAVNELVITPEFVTNIIAVDLADETTFTTADKAKLNGIEAGAQVNTVTRVAGKTGVVDLDAGDIAYDSSETYASGKIGAALKSAEEKLDTIEEGAEVNAVNSVNSKSGDVVLNAGDIGYDGSTTYDTGTVGKELTDLNRQISETITPAIEQLAEDLDGKAPAIYETVSGEIASFADGADGMPVKSLVANIEPVQDLHGYANPWPAGGGKNLLEVTGTTQTINGVTFTVNSDGTINVSGTASSGTTFTIHGYQLLSDYGIESGTTYILSGTPSGLNGNAYIMLAVNGSGSEWRDTTGSGASFTPSDVTKQYRVIIIITSGTTINAVFKPMICLASASNPTTYAPYSNICPISGHTGASVTRTGANIAEFTHGKGVDTGGRIHDIAGRSANVTPIKIDNTRKYEYVNSNINFAGIYAVWNGDTLVRRVAGMTSGTVMDTSGGDSLYVCGYSGDTDVLPETCGVFFADQYEEFEPYTGNQISVTFPSEAGTVYGGTLDVTNGVLTVDRRYIDAKGKSFAGGWSLSSQFVILGLPLGTTANINNYTGKIKTSMRVIGATGETWRTWFQNTSQLGVTFDRDVLIKYGYDGNTAESARNAAVAFENSMADGSDVIVYPIPPITYQLTPQEIDTLLGQNNVWTDVGTVDVEYPADTKLYIEQLTKPTEDDMTANANIAANKFFMIGNMLYFSTTAIAQGATIIPGTNCNVISLADALNNLNS